MDVSELDIDDDLMTGASVEPVNETQVEGSAPEPQEDGVQTEEGKSALDEFLKSKGIADINKIKFEDDGGNIEERSWNDLTEEEKFNILSTQEDTDETDLSDEEVDLINRLRLSNMSVKDFLGTIGSNAVNAYQQSISEDQQDKYTVDDLSDEELYVLDLQARVPGITDEELEEALDRAKSNEELFNKEVAGLRDDYKRMEDQRNQQQEAIDTQKAQEEFAAFSSNIVNGINSFNSIGDLDVNMSDDDKDALYNFITGVDNAGVNLFAKALSDPETIVKTAWFALYGEDIINSISDYYKSQIQAVAKANYNKGLAAAKPKAKSESKVVIKNLPNNSKINAKSIDDLD